MDFFKDPFSIVLILVLVVLVVFMFRNSRKRRADQERLRNQMVPGAQVMTNFGLFGTLLSIDEDKNIATIETNPGSIVRVHRQTLARVVEDDETTSSVPSNDEIVQAGDPEFGERASDVQPDAAPSGTARTTLNGVELPTDQDAKAKPRARAARRPGASGTDGTADK